MAACIEISESGQLIATPETTETCNYVLTTSHEYTLQSQLTFNAQLSTTVIAVLLGSFITGHITGRIIRLLK